MELIEAKRQNQKLQAQVRELQKQVDKQNLITDEQNQRIQTVASKDPILQYINVLIKGTVKQSEKTDEASKKLEKNKQQLKQAIETLQTQLNEIEEKERNLLNKDMSKNYGKDQQKYEQRKHEIQMANYALKTGINKKLTLREKQMYDCTVKLKQS